MAPFFRNTPAYLVKKHQAAKERLPKFETTVQWSMVQGSGYRGATHPGAGKSFSGIMNGSSYPDYDSDCIYINPSRKVFAVSDSPGMTYPLFWSFPRPFGKGTAPKVACWAVISRVE
jgi:hypothetical protein